MSKLDTYLHVSKPRLIQSIPYSDFSASTTYYPYFAQSLTRNARHRTYNVHNLLNVNLSGNIGFFPYDSNVSATPAVIGSGFNYTPSAGLSSGSQIPLNDQLASGGNVGALAAAVDSFQGAYTVGATAPTSGSVDVYMTEEF